MGNIKELLGVWKMPISVESIKPGKVRIFGYYGNAKAWEEAKNNIKEDVPGIKLLKDDVLTGAKLKQMSSIILSKYQLSGKVQIIPENRVIVAKGMISKQDMVTFRKAMENFEHGITAPTNPMKESIISYAGQKNRSRIIRPLDDEEGGLVLPDYLKN